MSETRWVPYREELDKRPKPPRPRVKHITVFNNYALAQLYDTLQAVFIGMLGYFVIAVIILEEGDTRYESYLFKAVLSLIGVFGSAALYKTNIEEKEELIEDLQ